MRASTRRPCRLVLVGAALLMMLSACGSSNSTAVSTLTAQAIYASARQTFTAAAAADLVLSSTTQTPPATALLRLIPPSPTSTVIAAGPTACDSSIFVADVTIPDGTAISAAAKFTKTWVLQNSGTCEWSTSYKLAFSSGDQMGGTDVFIPVAVPAGQQVTISVDLIAPAAAGTYKGTWRMENDQGQAFGAFPYVQITVGAAAVCRRSSRTEVTIAGHAGPESVTINYGEGVVVTDANGNYSFTVSAGWTGTVTPSKAKVHPWTFSPDHISYSNLTCDLLHENYIATAPPGS